MQRKYYVAEVEKLRKQRPNVLQYAPPYSIETATEQVEFELPMVADDKVHFSITQVGGLPGHLAGKEVFVKFCLSFPSQTPHEGKTPTIVLQAQENGTCGASFESVPSSTSGAGNHFLFALQRSRGTQRLFEIKKAFVEVWRPGSLLRNPEMVARGYQELVGLFFPPLFNIGAMRS